MINKAQGQHLTVGVTLNEVVFAHGQLYVAITRTRNSQQLEVFIEDSQIQGNLLNSDKAFTHTTVSPRGLNSFTYLFTNELKLL